MQYFIHRSVMSDKHNGTRGYPEKKKKKKKKKKKNDYFFHKN